MAQHYKVGDQYSSHFDALGCGSSVSNPLPVSSGKVKGPFKFWPPRSVFPDFYPICFFSVIPPIAFHQGLEVLYMAPSLKVVQFQAF